MTPVEGSVAAEPMASIAGGLRILLASADHDVVDRLSRTMREATPNRNPAPSLLHLIARGVVAQMRTTPKKRRRNRHLDIESERFLDTDCLKPNLPGYLRCVVQGVVDLLRARVSRVKDLRSAAVDEQQNPTVRVFGGCDDRLDEIARVQCA